MKWSTKIFILFQILDIALTFFALSWGLANEMNPFGFTISLIIFKFTVIIGVSIILELVNFGKLVYIVLLVPILVVIWNLINIILGVFLYFR